MRKQLLLVTLLGFCALSLSACQRGGTNSHPDSVTASASAESVTKDQGTESTLPNKIVDADETPAASDTPATSDTPTASDTPAASDAPAATDTPASNSDSSSSSDPATPDSSKSDSSTMSPSSPTPTGN